MPPRRKWRRTAGPADDTVDVQFVPDPVEISPQAAVEASTSFGVGSEGLSDAMVSSIVAAVKTAIQSTDQRGPEFFQSHQSGRRRSVTRRVIYHQYSSGGR